MKDIYESIYQRTFIVKWGRKNRDGVWTAVWKMNSLQFHCSLLDQRVYELYREYKYVLLDKYLLDKEEFMQVINCQCGGFCPPQEAQQRPTMLSDLPSI